MSILENNQQMRIAIVPLKAVSVLNQANLIKKTIEHFHHDAIIKTYIDAFKCRPPNIDGVIFFTLGAVAFLQEVLPQYIMCKAEKIVYATVEGVPSRVMMEHGNFDKLDIVAVSKWVADQLRKAGLSVIDWVHHAIDIEESKKAIEHGDKLRQKLEREYPNRVKFLYVGRNDPRKGLNILAKAVEMLNEKAKDQYILLTITDNPNGELWQKENVKNIAKFGDMPHFMVLAYMRACDYLVFPTMSEGFGLPLLEANSVGRPVIHAWIPPLDEFSDKTFNFVFDFDEIKLIPIRTGQYWVLHVYDPYYLADTMQYAIDIYKNNKDDYEKYCEMAIEHSWKWDYRRVYPRLLRYVGLDIDLYKCEIKGECI